MKKNIILLIIVSAFFNCKSLQNENDIYGSYYKKGKDFEYSLNLSQGNTFSLTMKYQDANPSCEGSWEKINDSEIFLKCKEVENPTEMLSSGYMKEREHTLQIVSRDKIKFKGVVLKKK